jgi:glutamyl-tRNA reductase
MSLPNQSEIAEVKSSSSMNFEMILDIAFPKDGNKDELTIVSLDVFSVEDITDILALLSSPANTNKNDKSSCLLSINEVSNQCTSGFKAQVCDALHNH